MPAEKQQKYEDYITEASPMAAAIGRREPYHLTFIKKYGAVPAPDKKEPAKGVGEDDQNCL